MIRPDARKTRFPLQNPNIRTCAYSIQCLLSSRDHVVPYHDSALLVFGLLATWNLSTALVQVCIVRYETTEWYCILRASAEEGCSSTPDDQTANALPVRTTKRQLLDNERRVTKLEWWHVAGGK